MLSKTKKTRRELVLETRLHDCIERAKLKKAILLITDTNCDVNWFEPVNGWTSLMKSSYRGYSGVTESLLKRPELLINHQTRAKNSALILASYRNNIKCVELLVNNPQTDINLVDENERSALWWAYRRECLRNMKLLISHGANVKGIIESLVEYTTRCAPPSDEATKVMENWKLYLPAFKRYAISNKYYPREFKQWAFNFVLCCVRNKTLNKDMIYLLLEYIAEAWKLT